MVYTTPPALGVKLPRLGFGAMRFPLLPGSEEVDIPAVQEMVDCAMRSGVNYFDTGYGYHRGKSECVLREVLAAYPRESYILVDKLPIWKVETPGDLEEVFCEQLEKCGVEYFDFYYIHAVNSKRLEKIERLQVFDFMRRQRDLGRIRKLGFSFHDTPEFFEKFVNLYDWDLCQVQLNYLDWSVQRGEALYRAIEKRGIPAVIMEPVRGGLLARLPEDILAPLRAVAGGKSPASYALRWAAELPQAAVVLSGMSDMAQLRENMETLSDPSPMTAAERAALEETARLLRRRFEIPCTGCGYCMDCPSGVDIPRQFGAYNLLNLFGDGAKFLEAAAKGGAEHCVQCGACVPNCPQHIDIPALLGRVRERADALSPAAAK